MNQEVRAKRSEVITALADLASQGKYEVSVQGAVAINKLYAEVAQVINELEAEEAAEAAAEVSNES